MKIGPWRFTVRLRTGRLRSTIAVGLIVIALSLAGTAVRAAEVIDRVVAVVAGEIILLSDVRAARELGLVEPEGGTDPDRETLTRLIDRALMLAEVDRYAPPEPGEDAVNAALTTLRARSASTEAFSAILVRVGLEDMHLREILRQNLRIQAYLDQRFPADTDARQRELIAEWLAGLRRRAEIVDLYAAR
ncbi:MAG: hypothetical protein GEU82_03110 [Luteitalea sp.]|nr:hypothetical protein [Luteitalea sp.]